jgi:hypothetical protein
LFLVCMQKGHTHIRTGKCNIARAHTHTHTQPENRPAGDKRGNVCLCTLLCD